MGIVAKALQIIEMQKREVQTKTSKSIDTLVKSGDGVALKRVLNKDIIFEADTEIGKMGFIATPKIKKNRHVTIRVDGVLYAYQNTVFLYDNFNYDADDELKSMMLRMVIKKQDLISRLKPMIIEDIKRQLHKIKKTDSLEEKIMSVVNQYKEQTSNELTKLDKKFIEVIIEYDLSQTTEQEVLAGGDKNYRIHKNINIPKELQNKKIDWDKDKVIPKNIMYYGNGLFYNKDKQPIQIRPVISDNDTKLPSLPKGANVKIDPKLFELISKAADKGNPKYELDAVLLDVSNENGVLVATTTRVLVKSIDLKLNIPDGKYMIPRENFKDILNADGKFQLSKDNLIISTKDYDANQPLIQGQYPAYNRILPSDLGGLKEIQFPSKFIKWVNSTKGEYQIEFKDGVIKTKGLREDTKAEQIDLTKFTENISFNINIVNLSIAIIGSNDATLYYETSNRPIFIKTPYSFGAVMPIVL